MKATISQMFDYFPGNHGLTEEIIYNSQPASYDDSIPIFSGSKDNVVPIGYIRINSKNNKGDDIKVFNDSCLILTKDGSAGLMTYRDHGIFTINHHACVLKVKKEWEEQIDPQWFSQQFQQYLFQFITSKSDNRVFSTDWFERIEFQIAQYPIQLRQKHKKNTLIEMLKMLDAIRIEIMSLFNQSYKIKNTKYDSYPISIVFNIKGGNSGLTEEFVYHNLPETEEEKIEILTSSTLERTAMGFISMYAKPNNKKLKIFESASILVARNGYAGTMTYIPRGRFTTNDHAYVLTTKKAWKDKINLEWFVNEYQALFLKIVTSKSDNATFNKEYAERQIIRIPHIDDQNRIIQTLTQLKFLLQKLNTIEKQINDLFEYSII